MPWRGSTLPYPAPRPAHSRSISPRASPSRRAGREPRRRVPGAGRSGPPRRIGGSAGSCRPPARGRTARRVPSGAPRDAWRSCRCWSSGPHARCRDRRVRARNRDRRPRSHPACAVGPQRGRGRGAPRDVAGRHAGAGVRHGVSQRHGRQSLPLRDARGRAGGGWSSAGRGPRETLAPRSATWHVPFASRRRLRRVPRSSTTWGWPSCTPASRGPPPSTCRRLTA